MKKIMAICLSATLCMSSMPVLAAQTFTDVTETNYQWAHEAIEQFVEAGIVNGMGDGRFLPEKEVTREQFAKMLLLTMKKDPVFKVEASFADVSANRWSAGYIEACKEYFTGVETADGQLQFMPTQAATREEIAVALVKCVHGDIDMENVSYAEKHFSDADSIAKESLPYISLAAEKGWINGYEDGTFRGNAAVTRAEAVVMLQRATQKADTTEETLQLTVEDLPKTTTEATVSVKGTATHAERVTVNDKAVTVAKEGSFSTTVSLKSGDNTITVVAEDASGNKKEVTKTIRYEAATPITESDFYGYVVEDGYSTGNGASFTIWDGKTLRQIETDSTSNGIPMKGQVVAFSKAGNDLDYRITSGDYVAITGINNAQDQIAVQFADGRTAEFEIDDSVGILFVDGEKEDANKVAVEAGSLRTAHKDENGNYVSNAYCLFMGGRTLDFIVYDVSGEMESVN